MKKSFSFALVAALLSISGRSETINEANIYHAIRSGEQAPVEQLLRHGLSPNARDANGNTLLLRAALYGTPELLRFLIDHGADVNATNNTGSTALMRAADDPVKIKLLVERGAHVNARSALGNTPLILAARRHGAAESVKLLLDRGADVNATNVFGGNAIMTAAAASDPDTVRLLLKHGANPNSHSRGSLDVALFGGGRSPLMWAAARGNLPVMKLLLKAGANVNEQEGFGTALTQAAWMDQPEAARLLLKHRAQANDKELFSGFTALHWAASSEHESNPLVDLLLKNGANPDSEGGEQIDAFLGTPQTPLLLAQKRGDTAIAAKLLAAGAKASVVSEKPVARGNRELPNGVNQEMLRFALGRSIPPLEETARVSKTAFVTHASKQDCVSCHQQYLPLSATALARKSGVPIDLAINDELLAMVRRDNTNFEQMTIEATFHPEPGHAYGYALFALAAQEQPADEKTDAMVHHLLVVQGEEGQWHNNLPRPPIQTSDVAPTALAIKALSAYGFPARQNEISQRIAHARKWLGKVKPANTEERTYQLMGLAWAGESLEKLHSLAAALIKEQRTDGGWAQLPKLESDAYATGQALFALHLAGSIATSPETRKGLEYLLRTQLDDGTWHVARRAFPFQPSMRSGFPHSRDSWISCAATSWAAMALAQALDERPVQVSRAE